MSVMKEWECAEHGVFDGTHPICPEVCCASDKVTRVFLTPPTISDGMLKRFNKGLQKSADMMGIGNFRTAREGESAYGNAGKGMLWGNDVQKVLGVDMATLQAQAAVPLNVTLADGRKQKIEKSVMRELGAEGITGHRALAPLPAERIGAKAEQSKDTFRK